MQICFFILKYKHVKYLLLHNCLRKALFLNTFLQFFYTTFWGHPAFCHFKSHRTCRPGYTLQVLARASLWAFRCYPLPAFKSKFYKLKLPSPLFAAFAFFVSFFFSGKSFLIFSTHFNHGIAFHFQINLPFN